MATWIRDELLKPSSGRVWHIVDLLPSWSLAAWLAVGFALLVALILEGSYRQAAKTKVEHGTQLRVVQGELDTERAKNSKPEITVTMDSATFERSWPIGTGRNSTGDVEDVGQLQVVLVVSFRNGRPQKATIDRCDFAMYVGSDPVIGFRRPGLFPLRPGVRIPAPRYSELEPNALVEQGKTVTRSIAFQITERTPTGKQFPDSGVFEFIAFDSFGQEHRIKRLASCLHGSCGDVLLG